MSIRIKLFLTFLLITFLAVMGMYFFTNWSLERGFAEFVAKKQQERLDKIIDVLEEYYAEHHGWDNLTKNKQEWIALLWHADPHRHRPPKRIIQQAQQEPENQWPPTFTEETKPKWLPFGLRVMLLDKHKLILFGQEKLRSQLSFYPIYHEYQTVGYLGLLPGNLISCPIPADCLDFYGRGEGEKCTILSSFVQVFYS